MFVSAHQNPFTGYQDLLRAVYRYGDIISPRGMQTRETEDMVYTTTDPHNVLLAGFRPRFSSNLAALEALQLVGGFSDADLTVHIAPFYRNFADDGKFHGAYGLRTGLSLGLTVDRLQQDRSTRQANAQFWRDSLDLSRVGMRDYPCTMHANFRVRHESLRATFVMRSNDAWLGFPYDIFQFTTLQRTIASFLNIDAGTYTHIAHSMHLYERDMESVESLLEIDADAEYKAVDRPLMSGGIQLPPQHHLSWANVQRRARQICYEPEAVEPLNSAEEWLIERAKTWTDRLDEREMEPDASGLERFVEA